MKFTVGWLKEHLDTQASLEQIVEKLTMVGLEVEKVTNRARGLETFVVGYVVAARQHPNADRLRVCDVDTGSGRVELVCGAPNARTGMKGAFAPGGAYIPGTGITLKPTEIRGVVSNGMLL
ncbi:MAG: phenylalanine--tRNA ligase subunit beta, partial [Rhodospirillales bacterium]|nr:phenylalanine--tRNA ligase subunit beta [Rhodospirillales bacterium]